MKQFLITLILLLFLLPGFTQVSATITAQDGNCGNGHSYLQWSPSGGSGVYYHGLKNLSDLEPSCAFSYTSGGWTETGSWGGHCAQYYGNGSGINSMEKTFQLNLEDEILDANPYVLISFDFRPLSGTSSRGIFYFEIQDELGIPLNSWSSHNCNYSYTPAWQTVTAALTPNGLSGARQVYIKFESYRATAACGTTPTSGNGVAYRNLNIFQVDAGFLEPVQTMTNGTYYPTVQDKNNLNSATDALGAYPVSLIQNPAGIDLDLFSDTTLCFDDTLFISSPSPNDLNFGTPAIIFDGTNDFIRPSRQSVRLAGKDRTVSMWIKAPAQSSNWGYLHAVNSNDGNTNKSLFLIYNNANLTIYTNGSYHAGSTNITDDQWHHVAYTYNETTGENIIYLDGNIELTFVEPPSTISWNDHVTYGCDLTPSTAGGFYQGKMSEMSVWDTILTQSEIQQTMFQKIATTHPRYNNLIHYYNSLTGCDQYFVEDVIGDANGTFYENFVHNMGPSLIANTYDSIPGFEYDTITYAWTEDGVGLVSTNPNFMHIQTDNDQHIYYLDIYRHNSHLRDTIVINPSGGFPDLGPNIVISPGDTITLSSNPFDNYLWSNGDTSQTTEVWEEGTYTIVVSDNGGCVGFEEIDITYTCVSADVVIEDSLSCSLTSGVAFNNNLGGSGNYQYAVIQSNLPINNGDFEDGLNGWTISSGVAWSSSGNYAAAIGGGNPTIYQDIILADTYNEEFLKACHPPLHVNGEVYLPFHPSIGRAKGRFRIEYFDDLGNLIGSTDIACISVGSCNSQGYPCDQWIDLSATIYNYPTNVKSLRIVLNSSRSYSGACYSGPGMNNYSSRWDNISLAFDNYSQKTNQAIQPGEYTFLVADVNSAGCYESIADTMVIGDPGLIQITPLNDTAYCIYDSTYIEAPLDFQYAYNALSFDGTDDWLQIERLPTYLKESYSYSGWIKTSTGNSTIFNQGDHQLKVDASGIVEVSNGTQTVVTPFGVADGQWHYLGFTYNHQNDSVYVYVDSTRYGDLINITPLHNVDIALGRSSGVSGFYNGQLDEVKFWNASLDSEEMLYDYLNGVSDTISSHDQLLSYHSFETNCQLDISVDKRFFFTGDLSEGIPDFTGPQYVLDSIPQLYTNDLIFEWSNSVDTLIYTDTIVTVNFDTTATWYYWVSDGSYTYHDTLISTVHLLPTIDLGADATVCDSVMLDAGTGFEYLWSTSEFSQQISAAQTDQYWCEIKDVNSCINADTIDIEIRPSPMVNLSHDTTICAGEQYILAPTVYGTGALTYTWNDNSITPLQIINTSLNQLGLYEYWVSVQDGTGCLASDTINLEIVNCLGLEGVDDLGKIMIFPNPSNDIVWLKTNYFANEISYILYDHSGKVLLNGIIESEQTKIDIKELPAGPYILKVGDRVVKIIKI